jgi:hypothetical protein
VFSDNEFHYEYADRKELLMAIKTPPLKEGMFNAQQYKDNGKLMQGENIVFLTYDFLLSGS